MLCGWMEANHCGHNHRLQNWSCCTDQWPPESDDTSRDVSDKTLQQREMHKSFSYTFMCPSQPLLSLILQLVDAIVQIFKSHRYELLTGKLVIFPHASQTWLNFSCMQVCWCGAVDVHQRGSDNPTCKYCVCVCLCVTDTSMETASVYNLWVHDMHLYCGCNGRLHSHFTSNYNSINCSN